MSAELRFVVIMCIDNSRGQCWRGLAGLDHLSASPISGGFMGEAGMGVQTAIKTSEWRRTTTH